MPLLSGTSALHLIPAAQGKLKRFPGRRAPCDLLRVRERMLPRLRTVLEQEEEGHSSFAGDELRTLSCGYRATVPLLRPGHQPTGQPAPSTLGIFGEFVSRLSSSRCRHVDHSLHRVSVPDKIRACQ
nr:hypothetical protein CFP56_04504 [Quercus suber]